MFESFEPLKISAMAHVSVVCGLEGLRRLRRARKPTASKSSPTDHQGRR